MEPKDKTKKGVIIELKATGEDNLTKIAEKALEQIKEKDYKRDCT